MATAIALAAGGIALFDWLGKKKGVRQTITNNITTNMSIDAILNSSTECIIDESGSQSIEVETAIPNYSAQLIGNDSGCALCEDVVNNIMIARSNLEALTREKHSNYVQQVSNFDILAGKMLSPGTDPSSSTSQTDGTIGACTLPCTDIYVYGVNQSQSFKAKESCNVATTSTNSFQQEIKGSIDSHMKNQEDILGQLSDAFTSNQQNIATDLSTDMSSVVTNDYHQSLINFASSTQSVKVVGNSIYVNQLSQAFKTSMVTSLTVTNTLNNSLRQSAQYSISQTLLNKNDTIGDITTDFLNVINSYSSLIETITGQILIIVGVIMVIIALIIGTLYLTNKTFRLGMEHNISSYGKQQQQSNKNTIKTSQTQPVQQTQPIRYTNNYFNK
jgi:hypothetical protein